MFSRVRETALRSAACTLAWSRASDAVRVAFGRIGIVSPRVCQGAHGDFRVKVSAPSAPASTETRWFATTAQMSLTSGQRVEAASS